MSQEKVFLKAAQHEKERGYAGHPHKCEGMIFKEMNDLAPRPNFRPDMSGKKDDPEEAEKAKFSNGPIGRLAKSKKFEAVTISIILANALVIGYDIDYTARYGKADNLYDGPLQFVLFEVAFAVYFSFEILVRLLAYKQTIACLWDPWFVFDSILVLFMVLETFVLPFLGSGSPLGQLSILRLLRLLRITRMAKLMRAFPELMMIIKGITTATKAVGWTAILLVIITYTWAILFTNEYHQGLIEDEDIEEGSIEELFGSMGKSMLSLLVMGTILDDVTLCTDTIRATDNMVMLVAFLCYILINSFTMMNMLVGILVEVVSKTAEREKINNLETQVRDNIHEIFARLDKDGNDFITRREFMEMRRHKQVMQALSELQIEDKEFEMYAELLFESQDGQCDEVTINRDTLVSMLLRLRPGNAVQTLDFQAFKGLVDGCTSNLKDRISRVEAACDHIYLTLTESGIPADLWAPLPEDDPTGLRSLQPWPLQEPVQRINVDMLAQLERTASDEIIQELQRRLSMPNLEETGVPLSMMDEELQQRICAAEAFQSIGVPQPDPEWSKEAVLC